MKLSVVLAVAFSLLVGGSLFSSVSEYDDLTLFIQQVVDSGDIEALVRVQFHLADTENPDSEYEDLKLKIRLVMVGGEDVYVEFFEPVELSGIALVYLSREEVTFSVVDGVPWKQYRSSYQTDLINNLTDQFFGGLLESSNFTWTVSTEDDRRIYMIDPSEQRLRILGLIGGGGYVPNLMHIHVSFLRREGYFPKIEYVKITDRVGDEYLLLEVDEFKTVVDRSIFTDLRGKYYETFQK